MPLFQINNNALTVAKPIEFKLEKDIQCLIQNNLQTVFNCTFIATEFSTGNEHAGRIDTLALSEDNNPVIIEYKKVESSELVNQSLYYLSWIKDHKGDFQIAVNAALGKTVEVDWSDVRVICIAPGYKKYDLHAVQMMGANIELWQYRLYANNALYLEEVFRKSTALLSPTTNGRGKNPVMVVAGKKGAITRLNATYTFKKHLDAGDAKIQALLTDLNDFILSIDESVTDNPKKFYIAYKASQNFVCAEVHRNKITLFLKLNPKEVSLPKNGRDVTEIGHYGTGNFELTITNAAEYEESKPFIRQAFESIGG